MRTRLSKNYLGFIKHVRESSKPVLKQLYGLASSDVRTVTGCNLRNILLLTSKLHVDKLDPREVDTIKYHKIEEDEKWRVSLVIELVNLKHGDLIAPEGWTTDKLNMIFNLACTQ